MKLFVLLSVACLSHFDVSGRMMFRSMSAEKDGGRVYRWQEPILSFVKTLYRGRARSMEYSTLNEIEALTSFNLWTRKNRLTPQTLLTDDTAILSRSNFNASNPTVMFIHGWGMDGYSDTALINMKNEFLVKENCNFIAVDWEPLAKKLSYFSSAASIEPIGVITGDFLNFFITQGLNVSQLHIIGFSLGAHIAGKAADRASQHLPRVTGLDPAYPGFSMDNTDARLDITDAQFVDIIHTNSGDLLHGGLSFPTPIGHVDFWPNGGTIQQGCSESARCSHQRAVLYFTESINGKTPFGSRACSTHADWKMGFCANNPQTAMGLSVSTLAHGNYFLDTNREAPFAIG